MADVLLKGIKKSYGAVDVIKGVDIEILLRGRSSGDQLDHGAIDHIHILSDQQGGAIAGILRRQSPFLQFGVHGILEWKWQIPKRG